MPSPTLKAIERLKDVPIYILGSEDVISKAAEKEMADATESEIVRAAEEDDPVLNAISFARFTDGTFGWNINDPGHGFVIANLERPSDAAAAAALSGTGTWGPLLLTDEAKALRLRHSRATCSISSPATRTIRPVPSTTTSG